QSCLSLCLRTNGRKIEAANIDRPYRIRGRSRKTSQSRHSPRLNSEFPRTVPRSNNSCDKVVAGIVVISSSSDLHHSSSASVMQRQIVLIALTLEINLARSYMIYHCE